MMVPQQCDGGVIICSIVIYDMAETPFPELLLLGKNVAPFFHSKTVPFYYYY